MDGWKWENALTLFSPSIVVLAAFLRPVVKWQDQLHCAAPVHYYITHCAMCSRRIEARRDDEGRVGVDFMIKCCCCCCLFTRIAFHLFKGTRRFEDVVQTFQREAARMAQAVESEKRRSIGYRLLLDDLRKKKDQQLRNKMVFILLL